MSRVTIDLNKLQRNIQTIGGMMEQHGASWTLVSKVLCGHEPMLSALLAMGVRSLGDSRLENLAVARGINSQFEGWYLRLPSASMIRQVVSTCDVSLNSELEVIRALDAEARRQKRRHGIVIMIEAGDLREGILPGSLVEFYESVFELPNIVLLGIGANVGCLAGAVPNVDQVMQLALYHELLELKFGKELSILSVGSSAMLPMLLDGRLPKEVNHFRIGESVFLGTDLINGGVLPGLHEDVITLEAEIIEMKEKSLTPTVETSDMLSAFEPYENSEATPGQRGYRALVSVGHLDTDISGLTPLDPQQRLVGASSDIAVVYLGDDPGALRVGDHLRFRPSYTALLGLMHSRYVKKVLTPGLESFIAGQEETPASSVLPTMEDYEETDAIRLAAS